MSFWQNMPAGLLLRSNWTATCIAEYQGELSLDSFCAATGASFGLPVPLDRFIDYGLWVQQQVAPDVDRRLVQALEAGPGGFRLTLDDGAAISARRVVVAAGIELFANRPAIADGLPSELASHTGDHRDLRRFRGARVLVVGGGQSALECAALLQESGAQAEVAVRQDHLNWLHGGKYQRMLGRYARLVYAPTDVGPMGLSRLVAVPDLFRRLPRRAQDPARLPGDPPGWCRLAAAAADRDTDQAGPHRGLRDPAGRAAATSPSLTVTPRSSTTCSSAPATGWTSRVTRS